MKSKFFKRISVAFAAVLLLCMGVAAVASAAIISPVPGDYNMVVQRYGTSTSVKDLEKNGVYTIIGESVITDDGKFVINQDFRFSVYIYNTSTGEGVRIGTADRVPYGNGTGDTYYRYTISSFTLNNNVMDIIKGGECRFVFWQWTFGDHAVVPTWEDIKANAVSDVNAKIANPSMDFTSSKVQAYATVNVIGDMSIQGVASGYVGSNITINAVGGFASNVALSEIKFINSATGTTFTVPNPQNYRTNANGSLNIVFAVPSCVQGDYTVKVTDSSSNEAQTYNKYTVNPQIIIDSPVISPGGELTITGTGFPQGRIQGISLGSNSILGNNNFTADTSGNLTIKIAVPVNIASGSYAVTVTSATGEVLTASGSLTIRTITFVANPSAERLGYGDSIVIYGEGYIPNTEYKILIGMLLGGVFSDSVQVATITSDASGNIMTTVKLEGQVAESLKGKISGSRHIGVTKDNSLAPLADTTLIYFNTEGPEIVPSLTSPKDGSSSSEPLFTWSSAGNEDGIYYILNIYNAEGKLVYTNTLTTTSYQMTKEQADALGKGTYSWDVQAFDGLANAGEKSSYSTFKIGGISISFDEFPVWGWVVIGAVVLIVAGGVAYIIWRRSVIY